MSSTRGSSASIGMMYVHKKQQMGRFGAQGGPIVGRSNLCWIVTRTNIIIDARHISKFTCRLVVVPKWPGNLFLYHVLRNDEYALCMLLECLIHNSKCSHTQANPYEVERSASSVPYLMIEGYV